MNSVSPATFRLAKILWDYHFLQHDIAHADIILVLSSNDLRVADHAADIFGRNLAPLIVFSGGMAHADDLLATTWDKPEARMLAERAVTRGLPADKIILEEKAENTGDNFTFTAALLAERGIAFDSAILVQKPFMLRRVYATGMKHWPDKKLMVTAQNVSLEDYFLKSAQPPGDVINLMVGDLQRIRAYPEKGYQVTQEIPADVWEAYEQLVSAGYNKHPVR